MIENIPNENNSTLRQDASNGMKIVLATPLYPPELASPASYVKEISLRLSACHEVTVVAYGTTGEKVPGVSLVGVNKKSRLPVRLFHYTVALYKATRGVNIIYTQNGIAASLPAIVVGYMRKIPVVLRFVEDETWRRATKQNLTDQSFEKFLKEPKANFRIRIMVALQGFIFRHAKQVIVLSKNHREALLHGYYVSGSRMITIYNPAPKRELIPFTEKVIPYQIAAHAELSRMAGMETVIEALALIKKEFPDASLLVAGSGPAEIPLKAFAEERGVAHHTKFLGQVSRAEAWHLRKTSRVFVQSSLEPEVPDTVVWNFCTETPVIASDVPGLNEAVNHEETGLLVKPGDAVELAHAIRRIFTDDDLRIKLITGSHAILEEQFSWGSHMQVLFKALESVGTQSKNS